jgi:predicted dehydrogenase
MVSQGLCTLGGIVIPRNLIGDHEYETSAKQRTDEGWTVYEDLQGLLAQEGNSHHSSNLLVLPVPIPLHRDMTVEALENGFHVLCEKPAAGSLAELDSMSAAADAAGRNLWFGFQHPISHSLSTLIDRCANGAVGQLTDIVATVSWPRPVAYYRRAPWAGQLFAGECPVLDSPIQNAAAHFLHAALAIAATQHFVPNRVEAEHARVHAIETADTQVLRLTTSNGSAPGPTVFGAFSHATRLHEDPSIVVTGTTGTLRWRFPDALDERGTDGSWHTVYEGPQGEHINGFALHAALATLGGTSLSMGKASNLVGVEGARLHLSAVVAAFGDTPTVDFPPPLVPHPLRITEERDGEQYEGIRDLDAQLKHMASARALPSELSVPWAAATTRIDSALSVTQG